LFIWAQFLARRLANTKGVFQEEMLAERRRARTASRRARQLPPKAATAPLAFTLEQKSELKGKLTSGAYKVAFSNLLARPASTSSVPALAQSLDHAGQGKKLASEALESV
jgi:hypothetical protein